jgi:hypothetical protein
VLGPPPNCQNALPIPQAPSFRRRCPEASADTVRQMRPDAGVERDRLPCGALVVRDIRFGVAVIR